MTVSHGMGDSTERSQSRDSLSCTPSRDCGGCVYCSVRSFRTRSAAERGAQRRRADRRADRNVLMCMLVPPFMCFLYFSCSQMARMPGLCSAQM